MGGFGRGGPGMMRPGVFGTVASVSGDTLTITSKMRQRGTASTTPPTITTYTIDATSAKVTKAGAASTVSAIVVGDMVMVQGTVSGTSVAATAIRDVPAGQAGGTMGARFGRMPGTKPGMGIASHTPAFVGNGQPVIGGKVTTVSGSSVTVTTASNTVYAVDASSAKITKRGVTSATIANVTVGDSVVVQGTISGSSVTATTVFDQGSPIARIGDGTGSTTPPSAPHGFMGAIGGFFSHLFGFF